MVKQFHLWRFLVLALSVVLLSTAAVAQRLDPVSLYGDETLHWDSFAINITGACKVVATDSRTLGIGVSQIRLLDGSDSPLASVRPNSMDGNYFMGGGWQQVEGNPALAPNPSRWTDGEAPLTTFYYPIPAAAKQIEFTAGTPPCGQMSASVSVNGVTAGALQLPAGAARTVRIPLPATVRRFVHYELRGTGPVAISGIEWLDSQASVIGTTATPAQLDSSTSVAELDAMPPAGAYAWRVTLPAPAPVGGELLVSFNNASTRVLTFAAGQTAIADATADPLMRQADKKTRTDGWGDDFNARNGFRTWTSSFGYPAVQSNGATVSLGVPGGTNQAVFIDLFTAAPMPVDDYPYLSIRLKASRGIVYYIRPFGVNSSGQIQPLYQQNVSPTEGLFGTGDWQTHSISLKRLMQSIGIQNPAVTEIRLDIVNQQAAPASFELDWIRIHKAFQPDPGHCAATETDFSNHLDDDCNGLMDQDDEQAWKRQAFGRKLVLAYHYPWFGTPFGPSRAWENWAGTLSDFSDPTRPAIPIQNKTIDPNTFDPSTPGKRNLTSRFYPLDYRKFPNYVPPANGVFQYETYGGVDHYDSLDPSFVAAQVALAGRYGIDGFITERDLSEFYTQRYSVARDVIRASGLPFVIAPLYDNFYRIPLFGLLTERATPGMAIDLLQLYLDASSNDHALRFAGRPVLTAPFMSFLVSPDKWQTVISQASTPDSIPGDGTTTPGQLQSGAHNRVTFTFARADQPGPDQRYLSVAFRRISFLDQNFHELSRFTFGTAQARSQLVSGWSGDESDFTGTFVWAAGTQKAAALDLAIPTGAVFLQLECRSFMDQDTTTIQINNGSMASFDALHNSSRFTFRLTPPSAPPVSGMATKAPFALFLDSANLGDGFLSYGAYTRGSRVFVSSPSPILATVNCGYDDTKIRVPGLTMDREDGARCRRSWEQALAVDPDVVVINTWNEWGESTNIEPSVEFGYKYVELTLTYSLIFKGSLRSSALPSQLGLTVTRYAVQGTGTTGIDFNTSSPSTGAAIVFNNLSSGFLSGIRVTANGQSYPDWTADYPAGTLTIRLPGNATSFTIGPAATSSSAPTISAVFNSPSGSPIIAQNTWISIQGTNLATTTRTWQESDFVANRLPIQLDRVSVKVNGKPAYVSYISPTQVNVLTPADNTVGPVQVQVTGPTAVSPPATVQMRESAPAFFTFGGGKYVAGLHADGSYIGPATPIPGQSSPARPGETVVLFANGFGQTTPPFPDGQTLAGAVALPTAPVISIGGAQAQVTFAGLTGAGLYQFNVVVPAPLPDGDAAVIAQYGSSSTQSGVLISLQN